MEKFGYVPCLAATLFILILSGARTTYAQADSAAPTTIAAPQIGAEVLQLKERLRTLPGRQLFAESLAQLELQTRRLSEDISQKSKQTESAIQSGAKRAELQQSSLDWNNLKARVENLTKAVTDQATALEQDVQSLKSEESRWVETHKALKKLNTPSELLDLAKTAIADIRAVLAEADDHRGHVAALQQSIAGQGSIVSIEIDTLKEAVQESERSLLERDSAPLWKAQFGADTGPGVSQPNRGSYSGDLQRLRGFVRAHRAGLTAAAALALIALVFFVRFNRTSAPSSDMMRRPVALALFAFLVALMPLLRDAPSIVIGLVHLVGIIPVVRLLKPRLTKVHQHKLVAIIISVPLWHVIKTLPASHWIKRDLNALFLFVVILVFLGLLRESRRHREGETHRTTLTLIATSAGILLLALSLLANIFGYIGLSELLAQGTLTSAYRATVYYTLFTVGNLLIAFVLAGQSTRQGMTVHSDRSSLARRLSFALKAALFVLWMDTTLDLFAIRLDVYTAMERALGYPIRIGSFTFTAGSIVAFALTLAVGYLVATVIRAILGEAILPGLKLTNGLSNAIATVTQYVILVLVFLLALAVAGVELSKFALITGALGLGLGFGLQNVVNNFVSGLILLFERPVRLGDFVEVGGIGGQVRKIGVRSSTLHAADGSELIIPNANLISERVVNWTLMDTRRQIVLTVPIAYGMDPRKVRDLLAATVESERNVLRLPGPQVYFTGFGDSALNFEVRFWAPHPDGVGELRSDVALNIAAALSKAGIQIPMPHRILHVDRTDLPESA